MSATRLTFFMQEGFWSNIWRQSSALLEIITEVFSKSSKITLKWFACNCLRKFLTLTFLQKKYFMPYTPLKDGSPYLYKT